MGRKEVVLAGSGGQGLLLIGKILGEAAAIFEGKNAVQTTAYGVATRGGFSKSEVIISEEEIAFPEAMDPDYVVCLSPQAFEIYNGKIKEDALLIYDKDTIKCENQKYYGFSMTNAAVELKNIRILNMIALGILVKLTGIVSLDSIVKSLEKNSPEQFKEQNLRAFYKGFEMAP
ncbi:MAG: 2-oxoacid:acceptor oxidoreductase family protein [Thermovenabulum sp.]|uniref:2-oxoacid:acceptor oxidoreductase family protein n=1 Tax=Thermovenabulum sp. TaxID=3100335 RepID=UPI003C7A3437